MFYDERIINDGGKIYRRLHIGILIYTAIFILINIILEKTIQDFAIYISYKSEIIMFLNSLLTL